MAIDDQIPARAYEGIRTGPREQRLYETQAGVPVDGSDALARDPTYGSPFTLRLLPPDVLLDALNQQEVTSSIDIMDSAMRVNDSFADYERKIQAFQSNPLYAQSTPSSLQQFVSAGGVRFDARTGEASRANELAFADFRQAESVLAQLRAMVDTPPLTLLINPQSLTVTRSKKQQYSDRGRFGYIFDAWGNEQARLSITGRTGAWYAGTRFTDADAPQNFRGLGGPSRGRVPETSVPSGVQYFSKNDSASWQNFQQLRLFYQNNGYIFDTVENSEAHLWIGAVAIDYDQWTYVGQFDSFATGESAETANGGVEFSMEFTANFVFDHGQREFQVLPINSPTPSPADPLWTGIAGQSPSRAQSVGFAGPASNPAPPSTGSSDPLRQALIRSRG